MAQASVIVITMRRPHSLHTEGQKYQVGGQQSANECKFNKETGKTEFNQSSLMYFEIIC